MFGKSKNIVIFAGETQFKIIMSDKELNSYRFASGKEPTDEMLAQIMSEVSKEAIERKMRSISEFHEKMEKERKDLKLRWNNRINRCLNGQF